ALDTTFQRQMESLAAKDGWFVPASKILDFLNEHQQERNTLTFREKIRIELIWLFEKITHGSS
ncbi:MAG: hypothetical protein ACOYVF_01430, partial [Candidatus Zixiibacteriota bacterium]